MNEALLEIRDLKTHFPVERGIIFRRRIGAVMAVDGVTLSLKRGETLGLVGESGCGKSTLGRTILQLIPPTDGTVILAGKNLTELSSRELRAARADFQMIFQDPFASLNPRMTVFDTLAEAIRSHKRVPKRELPARVSELMRKVGLSPRFLKKYPHEFSGGQR
ncbi:MAG: ATP-binding cassette domain-containing protein, partial [Burkholderiales bacterium]